MEMMESTLMEKLEIILRPETTDNRFRLDLIQFCNWFHKKFDTLDALLALKTQVQDSPIQQNRIAQIQQEVNSRPLLTYYYPIILVVLYKLQLIVPQRFLNPELCKQPCVQYFIKPELTNALQSLANTTFARQKYDIYSALNNVLNKTKIEIRKPLTVNDVFEPKLARFFENI